MEESTTGPETDRGGTGQEEGRDPGPPSRCPRRGGVSFSLPVRGPTVVPRPSQPVEGNGPVPVRPVGGRRAADPAHGQDRVSDPPGL